MRKKYNKPAYYITLQGGSKDMKNYGDDENLPESDRLMVCQQKGVKQTHCNSD